MIDAFLHERSIDKPTNKEQLDLLNEEIALAELEIHETRIDEMDLEAALNFLRRVRLATPLSFGISARPNKNSDFQQYCFQMVWYLMARVIEPLKLV